VLEKLPPFLRPVRRYSVHGLVEEAPKNLGALLVERHIARGPSVKNQAAEMLRDDNQIRAAQG
jgi:hypothetical protein